MLGSNACAYKNFPPEQFLTFLFLPGMHFPTDAFSLPTKFLQIKFLLGPFFLLAVIFTSALSYNGLYFAEQIYYQQIDYLVASFSIR